MENKLFAYFDFNPTKAYPVVYGATYTETFNEEINSFNIVLDNVSEEDRLYFDRPYHFVKIVNEIPDGETGLLFNGKNSIIMLVDTFVENLNSMGDEKIYRYEIGLMNCIKLLEKIQCPNLMITHSLINEENEPIYVYIDRYMKLYSPKVKISTDGETWSYQYLLNWDNICGVRNPESTENDDEWLINPDPLFDVPAADMQMSEPTLRQVITNLMSQVACIPSCDFRTLTYINFREEPSDANVTDADGINFIKHSGASDSYASDLITSPSQTLQENNTVVADIVGFRDSANAIIKQTNNLQLEVRYPIYKINSVRMRTTDNKQGWFRPANENIGVNPVLMSKTTLTTNYRPKLTLVETVDGNDIWEIEFNYIYCVRDGNYVHPGKVSNIKVHFCNYLGNNQYEEVRSISLFKGYLGSVSWNGFEMEPGVPDENGEIMLTEDKGFAVTCSNIIDTRPIIVEDNTKIISISSLLTRRTATYNIKFNFSMPTISSSQFNTYASHIWFENVFTDYVYNENVIQFVPMSHILNSNVVDIKLNILEDNNNIPFSTLYDSSTLMDKLDIPANIGTYIDITPCIVENGRRRLLEVDYQLMDAEGMIGSGQTDNGKELKDLAKYIYGTMGYTIGDTKITGFSETYSRAQMWWSWTNSYFDTILNFIEPRKQRLQDFDWEEFLRVMEKEITDYKSDCGYENLNAPISEVFYVDLSGSSWTTSYNKMKFLFYIEYKPLNNFKYKATKEGKNFPLAIEQLNQSADGLSDFERVVKNLQDTTNRIGNPIKSLPQTTDDINAIKPLNSIYNDGHYDFTIFNRQFAIYENYLTMNYTASENYVIKNYFTSIITKYRAYEYVDYNAAIVRKENTKIYGYISDKHYYDGDDKLRLFNQFYSLDDLKNILGVADLTDYISYNDEPTKDVKYFSTFDLKFNFEISAPSSGSTGSSYFTINCKMDLNYNNLLSYDVNESYTPQGNNVFEFTRIFYSRFFVTVGFVYKYIVEAMNFYSNDIYNSLFDRYETYMNTPHLMTASFDIIQKLDGSILLDNNTYYKIRIFVSPSSDENLEEDGTVSLNLYPELYSVFRRADKKMYAIIKNYSAWQQKFNRSSLVIPMITTATVNIQLIEITDPLELDEAISNQRNKLTMLLSGLTTYDKTYTYRAKYCIKSSQNQNGNIEETKNEINTLFYDTGFSIYYQDYDNVSAGPQLFSINKETDAYSPAGVGGYIQKWQVWNQNIYGLSHQVFFTYQINVKTDAANIDSYIAQLPVINKGWEYQPYTLFQLVDNNKSSDLRFTFYKDNAEILNQTLQIEYYGDDLIVGKNFNRHNRIVGDLIVSDNAQIVCFDITGEKFALKDTEYDSNVRGIGQTHNPNIPESIQNFPPIDVDFDPFQNKSYIEIDWSRIDEEITEIKFALANELFYDNEGYHNNGCYDLIAFKRNNRTEKARYYLTLNDTKTNDVWYFPDPDDLFITVPVLNGLARNISNAAPEVLFDINWTDFNNEEDNSYSITVANNNIMPVVLHISGTNLTFNMSAESSITLQSTTDLNNELDDYVRYRESDLTCNFTGNIGENLTVILPAITVLSAPVISNDYIESYGDFIGLTTSIINNNDCLVILYMQGSSNATIITYEINPHTTLILSTDTNNPNYDAGFANSIDASLGAFFSGGLEDDYYCYFMDYGENIESNNTIILNTIPEPPHIQTITEEPNDFRYDITSDNPYTTRVYLKKGSQHVDAGSLYPNLHLSIGYGGDATITDWYNAWIDGQLEDDVVVYLVSYGYESDEVVLWRANG